jgi:hypothetical protein
MNKIYRKVQIPSSGLTNNINLNLFLTEKFTLMGVMDSDLTSEANNIYNTNGDNIVTGYTENRLSEVKTFDLQQPYKIGINGVTNINYTVDGKHSVIYYTIDGISYITDVINNEYIVGKCYSKFGEYTISNINAMINQNGGIVMMFLDFQKKTNYKCN